MEETVPSGRRVGGIPSNLFTIPLLIIVAVMHIAIIFLIIDVNSSSNELGDLMERSNTYQADATSLRAVATLLSETSATYIQMPVAADGASNAGSLTAYVQGLDAEGRGYKVAERFREYDVSDEVLACIETAAEMEGRMAEAQLHAISLMSSVYPLPPIPALADLPLAALTPEEQAMSPAEREAAARQLILEKDYAQLRYQVNDNVEECNRILQEEFSRISLETQRHIITMRAILWAAVIAIILILTSAFILFYRMIIHPLRAYSADIEANRKLKQIGGVAETRQLVDAFNRLWDHRSRLEASLQAAAENDALTGLPNRYCMERDILEGEAHGGPLAVLVFDVNFLKRTNDTQGHLAGDQLLRTAAGCISECFSLPGINNCYRYGGDEFVAFLPGAGEAEVTERIDRFTQALQREGITVSVGYACSDNADAGSVRPLMAQADERMYEQKRKIHEMDDAGQ